MIYKLDHIGITVRSLPEARDQIESAHPCFHVQHGIEVRSALSEVSIHRPERLDISLHRRADDISIELIEYPRVAERLGSMFPWSYDARTPLEPLKRAVGERTGRQREVRFPEIASLLEQPAFNAVVIPVTDLAAEELFWTELRFRKIHGDGDMAVLALRSLVPPAEEDYLILHRVDYPMRYHTDLEGINEIALLCSSCAADLKAFPLDVSRSSVDRLQVDGKTIDLGYLRSPSGVLAELFSVKLAGRERTVLQEGRSRG